MFGSGLELANKWYHFFLTNITDPTNIGITKLISQMQIPASAILISFGQKTPITNTAMEPLTAASENAKEGVKVTKR